MEGLEVVVLRKECSETVETLSRAPEVAESERGETLPTSTQVEVVRDRTSKTGAAGAGVRYVKILRQGQVIEHAFYECARTCKLGQLASNSLTRRSCGIFVVPYELLIDLTETVVIPMS